MTQNEPENETANASSGAFLTEEEREGAIEAIRERLSTPETDVSENTVHEAVDHMTDGETDDEESLYLAARSAGWGPDDCDCEPLCDGDKARLGISVPESKENANVLPPAEDPAYYDGGWPVCGKGGYGEYPTGTRSSYHRRQQERGEDEDTANFAAIPGRMDRKLNAAEPDEDVPAGGRKAWEQRKMGLSQTGSDEDVPAGDRDSWEKRTAESDPEYPWSAEMEDRKRQREDRARRGRRRLRLNGIRPSGGDE